jgi:hypothetical protein
MEPSNSDIKCATFRDMSHASKTIKEGEVSHLKIKMNVFENMN